MKTIIIKSMRLTNFKGVRDLSIDFNDSVTNIFGRNGSGKTTIFDAFTWLLFGKDSIDRKQFDLKTLDADGNIIAQIPHEVSAVIEVNGQRITLTRRFTEKWVKRAGQAEKTFDSNKEERFFNDVPCSKAEYAAKVAEICVESVFKLITSPTYFTSQSWQSQKALLEEMAGNITDAEVAGDNADFVALLDAITGKSLSEYKKEISAKKSRINDELTALPGNIEENKRKQAAYDAEDFYALDAELAQKRTARENIQKQLDDINEQQRVNDSAVDAINKEIDAVRQAMWQRASVIKEQALRGFYSAQTVQKNLKQELHNLQSEIASRQQTVAQYQNEVKICEKKRESLLATYRTLTAQQNAIAAETLQIDEAAFVCPTCKRPLDISDIEAKEAEMQKNFDEDKARRLQRIAEQIEQNKRDGRANNERKKYCEEQILVAQTDISAAQKRSDEIAVLPEYAAQLVEPTVDTDNDAQIIELRKKIDELTAKKNAQQKPITDTSDLKDGRAMLTAAIEELIARTSKRADAEENRQRGLTLESQMQTLNEELAELERQEFIIAEFSKARNAATEARINGLFSIVRFRWLKTLINGAVEETCEATVNGVPYSSLNHAGQINAGLDIINAACKANDICAPVFIDNAESINDTIPMQSQIVNLIVSHDEKLRVEA